jgi:hypothetical protein
VYASCCRTLKADGSKDSRHEVISKPTWQTLVDSIRSLVGRSPNLEMARVLRHRPRGSSRRLEAFDCLIGKESMLLQDQDWDARVTSDDDSSESTEYLTDSEISSLVSD